MPSSGGGRFHTCCRYQKSSPSTYVKPQSLRRRNSTTVSQPPTVHNHRILLSERGITAVENKKRVCAWGETTRCSSQV